MFLVRSGVAAALEVWVTQLLPGFDDRYELMPELVSCHAGNGHMLLRAGSSPLYTTIGACAQSWRIRCRCSRPYSESEWTLSWTTSMA